MRSVYDATRKLCKQQPKRLATLRNKEGKLLTKEEVQKRWKDHFEEVLNRPIPDNPTKIPSNSEIIEDIKTGPVTREEILNTIMCMKAGKAPGIDNFTVELLNPFSASQLSTTNFSLYNTYKI